MTVSGKGARRRQGAWQAREVMEQCRRQGQTTTRGAAKRRGAERERISRRLGRWLALLHQRVRWPDGARWGRDEDGVAADRDHRRGERGDDRDEKLLSIGEGTMGKAICT